MSALSAELLHSDVFASSLSFSSLRTARLLMRPWDAKCAGVLLWQPERSRPKQGPIPDHPRGESLPTSSRELPRSDERLVGRKREGATKGLQRLFVFELSCCIDLNHCCRHLEQQLVGLAVSWLWSENEQEVEDGGRSLLFFGCVDIFCKSLSCSTDESASISTAQRGLGHATGWNETVP